MFCYHFKPQATLHAELARTFQNPKMEVVLRCFRFVLSRGAFTRVLCNNYIGVGQVFVGRRPMTPSSPEVLSKLLLHAGTDNERWIADSYLHTDLCCIE